MPDSQTLPPAEYSTSLTPSHTAVAVIDVQTPTGLTSDEVRSRLEKFGPNAVPDTALHPLRRALTHLWAPVPWMLEAAVLLQLVLGEYVEGAVIAVLLVFNALLGFFQETRAQATLDALKSRLALSLGMELGAMPDFERMYVIKIRGSGQEIMDQFLDEESGQA